jgi:hypothetical protein
MRKPRRTRKLSNEPTLHQSPSPNATITAATKRIRDKLQLSIITTIACCITTFLTTILNSAAFQNGTSMNTVDKFPHLHLALTFITAMATGLTIHLSTILNMVTQKRDPTTYTSVHLMAVIATTCMTLFAAAVNINLLEIQIWEECAAVYLGATASILIAV